ncbi:MAG: FHA domain-containing protein, partial [Woeseia sp.]
VCSSDLLQAVLAEFGFEPFNKRKVELLDMLNMFLIEQYSNGKKVVLIVDEAQNLSKKVLEEIRMLSGIETHKEKVLRIILAGQPELRQKLESPRLKQLIQRVRLRFHIGPLDLREMHEYIEHRLEVAGHDQHDLFSEDCYACIHRYTGGVPRLINTLCDTALLCAYAEQKTTLTEADIVAAAEELGWKEVSEDDDRSANLPQLVTRHSAPLCSVQIRTDGHLVSEYNLKSGRVVIGRAPDNEIYIKSKFVSRHHAQIVCNDEGCIVEDLNSTNGIFIGNRRVKKHFLQDGDVVSLGIHDLVFRDLQDNQDVELDDDLDDIVDDEFDDEPSDEREEEATEEELDDDSMEDEERAANDSTA